MARISPGTMTAAIFAILVGLGGAFAVRQYLNQPNVAAVEPAKEPAARPDVVYVPVASDDLLPGRPLTINDMYVRTLSSKQFREQYSGKTVMTNTAQIVGRSLRVELKQGQSFEPVDFFPDGLALGVDDMLKPGFRAVSVPVLNVGAVSGFARPGSTVDVLFRSAATEYYPEVTMTLLEHVDVLAVGSTAFPGHRVDLGDGRVAGIVTLAVSPEQAKALKVVEGRGELTLMVRRRGDSERYVSRSSVKLTLADILDVPFIRKKKMDVYRGLNKDQYVFEEADPDIHRPLGSFIDTPIAADIPENPATSATPTSRAEVVEPPDRESFESGGGGGGR